MKKKIGLPHVQSDNMDVVVIIMPSLTLTNLVLFNLYETKKGAHLFKTSPRLFE